MCMIIGGMHNGIIRPVSGPYIGEGRLVFADFAGISAGDPVQDFCRFCPRDRLIWTEGSVRISGNDALSRGSPDISP